MISNISLAENKLELEDLHQNGEKFWLSLHLFNSLPKKLVAFKKKRKLLDLFWEIATNQMEPVGMNAHNHKYLKINLDYFANQI